jgi:hypothetical protein
MKSSHFLGENFVEDAHSVHQDHEVQMAREELYHAAEYALRLHKLLRNVDESQGLEGWVSSKITLANDYLKTVLEYMEYELMTAQDAGSEQVLAVAEDSQLQEMTAGSVATVVNPTPKNKAKTGTLFGGTYQQKKHKGKK